MDSTAIFLYLFSPPLAPHSSTHMKVFGMAATMLILHQLAGVLLPVLAGQNRHTLVDHIFPSALANRSNEIFINNPRVARRVRSYIDDTQPNSTVHSVWWMEDDGEKNRGERNITNDRMNFYILNSTLVSRLLHIYLSIYATSPDQTKQDLHGSVGFERTNANNLFSLPSVAQKTSK